MIGLIVIMILILKPYYLKYSIVELIWKMKYIDTKIQI
jgi:hypothetical protein